MAAGGTPLGYAVFVGVKFIGYSAAALALRKAYAGNTSPALLVGATRLGIGILAGTAYGLFWIYGPAQVFSEHPVIWYLTLLLPIRILEWSLLLHLYFDRGLGERLRALKFAVFGSGWSYVLDAVGMAAAFVVPGGLWVC